MIERLRGTPCKIPRGRSRLRRWLALYLGDFIDLLDHGRASQSSMRLPNQGRPAFRGNRLEFFLGHPIAKCPDDGDDSGLERRPRRRYSSPDPWEGLTMNICYIKITSVLYMEERT